ncbi:hypothetical protein C1631_000045 [Chryseobacterium phosphatilyticum]|uniref:Uncharacterized protein n=1 Tax=Chryseobacterium phosphatilyticum TaxID=475075 RepID=A0A316XEE7_9FLAO|nr:hypothetical protein [Chryseobacterium phosphatilyticum]PWN71056.1 hypothetical protein C1631_000045 [Chryseobacterium phosphatilyticum]
MITEMEQAGLDIDWFITDGEYIGFMASGGGKLPESVAKSKKNNELLVEYFRNLPEISEVVINPKLDDILIKIFGSGVDERYLEYYVSMTKKGLFSFDKTYPNQFSDPNYHLVTSPKTPLKLKELPQDILDIVIGTQYNNTLMEVQEINRLEIN